LDLSPQQLDYSPCRHYDGSSIDCLGHNALEVVDAFRRNRDNPAIEVLYFQKMDDMTDDLLAEILAIVVDSASCNLREIGLMSLPQVAKVPELLVNFTSLETLYLEAMDNLKILPSASVALPSSLSDITIVFNHNLEVIEGQAFQGDLNGTDINLSFNNLRKFDEAIFKPILSDSTATIQFFYNPISCDCDLAWILRDNREYLNRVTGFCNDENGKRIDFIDVDVSTLNNC